MRKFLIALLSLALLSGCAIASAETATPVGGTLVSPTRTASPLPSTTPRPTFTITPTDTPSPTASPTKKPLPTLAGNSTDEAFRHWLSGSPDCILPCWAGIVPGETSWEDTRKHLATVLRIDKMSRNTRCRFGECGFSHLDYNSPDGTGFSGIMFSKDNVFYSINLGGDFTDEMHIRKILETYGQPAQVFIGAIADNRGDPPEFFVSLFYPEFNFIVKYFWWAEVRKDKIIACGQPYLFNLGVVAINESQWTERELAANGDQSAQSANIWSLRPIADVTDMDVQVFYSQFVQNESTVCLSTSVDYWP